MVGSGRYMPRSVGQSPVVGYVIQTHTYILIVGLPERFIDFLKIYLFEICPLVVIGKGIGGSIINDQFNFIFYIL